MQTFFNFMHLLLVCLFSHWASGSIKGTLCDVHRFLITAGVKP